MVSETRGARLFYESNLLGGTGRPANRRPAGLRERLARPNRGGCNPPQYCTKSQCRAATGRARATRASLHRLRATNQISRNSTAFACVIRDVAPARRHAFGAFTLQHLRLARVVACGAGAPLHRAVHDSRFGRPPSTALPNTNRAAPHAQAARRPQRDIGVHRGALGRRVPESPRARRGTQLGGFDS